MPIFPRSIVLSLIVVLANLTSQGEKVQIQRLPINLIQQRLGDFAGNDSAREATLKRMFAEAAAKASLSNR